MPKGGKCIFITKHAEKTLKPQHLFLTYKTSIQEVFTIRWKLDQAQPDAYWEDFRPVSGNDN